MVSALEVMTLSLGGSLSGGCLLDEGGFNLGGVIFPKSRPDTNGDPLFGRSIASVFKTFLFESTGDFVPILEDNEIDVMRGEFGSCCDRGATAADIRQ